MLPVTGPELTALREEIGWTRRELARRLGKVPSHLDAMEWGTRPVPSDVASKVRQVAAAVRCILPLQDPPSIR